ncbi:PREDICTED: uncharacterized protein LOC105563329 isoform X2 [Vollenhovia emeryi]|uniref:uncharacterized protein LOC105563329 isoform X2 n=1 Tax=Vollenhovia emeryi TaxID=411798 RepID=UPI0005F55639|nr:PREDICTED: uncharacterized protein LOC105563329 isoform X2 [Vollenhovia emeryi]
MALILRKPRALTILVQTCIVMLIVCSVGCAAGSCLSYGHSCWGAHGKRSDVQGVPTVRFLAAKTLLNGSPQNGIAPSFKTQWILSRLIAGQPILPLTDKYRVRWGNFPKEKSYVPPKWNHDVAPMTDEGIESIRIPINNEHEDNERRISNTQGIKRNTNDKFENNREIFLISPGEYDKAINDPQKLDILKFLEGNGDTK